MGRKQQQIKTLCYVILLTTIFLLAVAYFAPKVHGQVIDTSQLFSTPEPTQPYIVASLALPKPMVHATIARDASKSYIEGKIRSAALQYGVDPDLAVAIAKAESGLVMKWNYNNKDGDPNSKWSAYGVFQIIKSHEKTFGVSRMTLDGNIEIAMKMLQHSTDPWILSKATWNP